MANAPRRRSAALISAGLAEAAPGSVRQIVLNAMVHLQHSHATAGILAAVGIVVGLWSASSYVAGFMRASNIIYAVPEGRPFWKTTPIRLARPLVMPAPQGASPLVVWVTGALGAPSAHRLGTRPPPLPACALDEY